MHEGEDAVLKYLNLFFGFDIHSGRSRFLEKARSLNRAFLQNQQRDVAELRRGSIAAMNVEFLNLGKVVL